jgi:hypothetical protein
MQGARRTVRGRRETLPCLLTFTSGSTGDKSGRSRQRTGEWAGSIKLRRCMMVVAASRGRRLVTVFYYSLDPERHGYKDTNEGDYRYYFVNRLV